MEQFLTWGWLSALLILSSGIPYAWAVCTRRTERPLISVWLNWTIIGFVFLVSYWQVGATLDTSLPAALVTFSNPTIMVALIFVLRYGRWVWTWLDSACVAVVIFTVMAWHIYDTPMLGLMGAIVADTASAIPQIRKNWRDPSDEPWFPWTMFAVGSAVNLAAVDVWVVEKYLYPLYASVGSITLFLPVVLHSLGYYKR